MNKLARMRDILDTRLTTEALDQVYPQTKSLEEVLFSPEQLLARHKAVRIDLLEYMGNWVEMQTGEPLGGEGLAVVMDAVDDFLISRGFNIKG